MGDIWKKAKTIMKIREHKEIYLETLIFEILYKFSYLNYHEHDIV